MFIALDDPFNAAQDQTMPTLASAMDPLHAERAFRERLPRLFAGQDLLLTSIRIVRYKPARRCMIEYTFDRTTPGGTVERFALIGKVMARRYGKSGYRRLSTIWNTGFDDASEDGISVPEPIGHIPSLQMWIQRKIPGRTATDLLTTPAARDLLRRIAEAAHKLHTTNIETEKSHSIADEIRILRERLPQVALAQPAWSLRIERLLNVAERLGAQAPAGKTCGIHRDFYPDQIIVDGARLYLIDFDLFCHGDPGLDIGNFIGHITELSLRTTGDPHALLHLEQTLEDEFVALSGPSVRAAVKTYAALTRVRHIYLSTLFDDRRRYTEALLEYCERQLAVMTEQPMCIR